MCATLNFWIFYHTQVFTWHLKKKNSLGFNFSCLKCDTLKSRLPNLWMVGRVLCPGAPQTPIFDPMDFFLLGPCKIHCLQRENSELRLNNTNCCCFCDVWYPTTCQSWRLFLVWCVQGYQWCIYKNIPWYQRKINFILYYQQWLF